jgi:hypothetical protein
MQPMTFLQFELDRDGAVESLTVKFYDPIEFDRAEQ